MDLKVIVTANSIIYREQNEFLFDFYLPIISYKSLFLYEYFFNVYKSEIKELSLDNLYKYTNLNKQDFLLNRRTLESIGLIKTYKKDQNTIIVVLYAPLDAKSFIENKTFKELLVSRTDENYINYLIDKYSIKEKKTANLENISAEFKDSFKIEQTLSSKLDNKKFVGINKNEPNIMFDTKEFLKCLKEHSNIRKNDLSEEEINEVARIQGVYGIELKEITRMVVDSYTFSNEVGSRLNFKSINERVKAYINTIGKTFKSTNKKTVKINSETELANRINHYENTPPRKFLKEKQDGREPVIADLNLINDLSSKLGLSNGVINCLIDYVIKTKNGNLSRIYVEKIAANMKRAKVETSLDAINYFNRDNSQRAKTSKKNDLLGLDLYDGSTVESIVDNDNAEIIDEEFLWKK